MSKLIPLTPTRLRDALKHRFRDAAGHNGLDISISILLSPAHRLHLSPLITPSQTDRLAGRTMAAPPATQDGGPVLADDLMRDRARQFVEFLDDDVSW
jgi:hypothetical protein